MASKLHLELALTPDGWRRDVVIGIDRGIIAIAAGSPPPPDAQRLGGIAMPGLPNLHSHAHQRGLAGRAEGGSGATEAENFWTWRTRMYDFALRLSPDDLRAIAAQAYVEMLKAGFTTVGEFHYLHHDPAGRTYANPAETLGAAAWRPASMPASPSRCCRRSTRAVGRPAARPRATPLHPRRCGGLQRAGRTRQRQRGQRARRGGRHRAAQPARRQRRRAARGARRLARAPVHMHVAEQVREVEECVAGLGAPPARAARRGRRRRALDFHSRHPRRP